MTGASPSLIAAYLVNVTRQVSDGEELGPRSYWAIDQARRHLTLEKDELVRDTPDVAGPARAQLVGTADSAAPGLGEHLMGDENDQPDDEAEFARFLEDSMVLLDGVESGDRGAARELSRRIVLAR